MLNFSALSVGYGYLVLLCKHNQVYGLSGSCRYPSLGIYFYLKIEQTSTGIDTEQGTNIGLCRALDHDLLQSELTPSNLLANVLYHIQ